MGWTVGEHDGRTPEEIIRDEFAGCEILAGVYQPPRRTSSDGLASNVVYRYPAGAPAVIATCLVVWTPRQFSINVMDETAGPHRFHPQAAQLLKHASPVHEFARGQAAEWANEFRERIQAKKY